MTPNKRIYYLDAIKTLTIFLVIWGHALVRFDSKLESGTGLYIFIYSFHMPLFMVISGFFSVSSFERSIKKVINTKIKQLIVPIISWTIITCVYMFLMNYPKVEIRTEIIGNNWFLKTLFVCYIYSWIANRLIPFNKIIVFILSWSILLIIPNSSFLQINWLYIFFWIGIFLRYNIEHFNKAKTTYLLVCFIILPLLFFIKFDNGYNNYIPLNITTLIDSLPIHFIRFTIALLMVFLFFLLVQMMYEKWGNSQILSIVANYGLYTLGIYVLQSFFLDRILTDFLKINHQNHVLYQYLYTPLISFIVLFFCIIIIRLLSKNKLLDTLLFGGQYFFSNKSKK